ncbi:MAG TPA: Nramp family divalent metal transporter [Pyrinomonadaceae bacterium]|jgi:NRAMP (natural resistance-associated macrophage protein)-like metal ion transporter
MSRQPAPEGLEPIESVEAATKPKAARTIPEGMRVNIRGRSVRLRGLRRQPIGLLRWLLILGPGLIATSAGNDAGGIATYSSAGAKYGYDLIWVMLLLTISYAVVQEMCSRLGAATGRGLLDLIRERYGLAWATFAVIIILVANGGVTVSEFVGISAAVELLGINKYIVVPMAAALIWYLVIFGSYNRVEKIFILMTLVFFAYPAAAFMAHPDWKQVARGAFVPTIHADPDYIFILVGLLGTTLTPYIQIFQQSSLVEKGVARRHYKHERVDAYFGAFFSNLMSVFMIIACAATLHVIGKTEIGSAADAAKALEPVVGSSAKLLFAIGLLGASLLAGAVLPLATSYAISEAFGIPKGVNLDFRRGRVFFSLFTALIVIGTGLALIPNLPVIQLLVAVQVLNGILLPIILVFILKLINDKSLTGDLKNTPLYNVLGWGTFAVITTAVVLMLGSQLLKLLGINLFG